MPKALKWNILGLHTSIFYQDIHKDMVRNLKTPKLFPFGVKLERSTRFFQDLTSFVNNGPRGELCIFPICRLWEKSRRKLKPHEDSAHIGRGHNHNWLT